MEAHRQNTLVTLDALGWPVGGWYRDNQGYYVSRSRGHVLRRRGQPRRADRRVRRPLGCKANLLTRVDGLDELAGPVESQSVYVEIPNPFMEGQA